MKYSSICGQCVATKTFPAYFTSDAYARVIPDCAGIRGIRSRLGREDFYSNEKEDSDKPAGCCARKAPAAPRMS